MNSNPQARILIVSLILSLFAVSCSRTITSPLMYQQHAVSVESADKWAGPAGQHMETGLSYAITNDHRYLYVLLQTDDPMVQMKILRAGMELVIDTLGRKKGHMSVAFPSPVQAGAMMEGMVRTDRQRGGRPVGGMDDHTDDRAAARAAEREAMYRAMIDRHDRMTLTGFRNHPNGQLPLLVDSGIQLNLDLDTAGILSYRAIIPLRTFYREQLEADGLRKVFSLSVTVRGLSMAPGSEGGMRQGGMREGGIGTPGGQRPVSPRGTTGNIGPGRAPMAGGDVSTLMQDQTLRLRFGLTKE